MAKILWVHKLTVPTVFETPTFQKQADAIWMVGDEVVLSVMVCAKTERASVKPKGMKRS
jgi:hypothetical protein